jgi:hypothetical protein
MSMKVYFTGALSGKPKYLENYKAIVRHLKYRGFRVFAEHILTEGKEKEVKSQTAFDREKVYKELLGKIKGADFVVAEISTPSVSIGHEISYALELAKPVIVLHVPGESSSLLEGRKDERLQMSEYMKDNLKQVLDGVLEDVRKKMDVRFNFFVSPKILAYLDWVAKTKRIPRSVFLRDLIEKEMKKDKEFKE